MPFENVAAQFQLLRGFVVAAIGFTTTTQLFRTPELLFEKTKFPLVMFFVRVTTDSVGNFLTASVLKLVVQYLTAVASSLLSFHGVYSLPAVRLQEQGTENPRPIPTLQICFNYTIW